MRQERQVELLQRLVGIDTTKPWSRAAASLRNPAASYTNPARFQREMTVLFRGRPQFVAMSGEVEKPGSYLTAQLGGVPILVTRQPDGTLRALVNACRHRGATLLHGCGAEGARRIVCPYHGWAYDSDGRLLARPGAGDGFDDLTGNFDLHQRAVSEKYGLIFVHPSSAEPFEVDDVLCGAESEIADYGLEKFVHIETRSNTWAMNWKLVLDTFTESYHLRFLHRDSIAPYFLCDTLFDAFGPHPRAIGLRSTVVPQLTEKPRGEWQLLPHATAQYFLVPNGLVVYQLDHIEVWRLTPVDAGTTKVATSIYAPTAPHSEKARGYWKKNLDLLLKVTETEDFPAMVQIQSNLASGALPEVVYGRIEPALSHLHASINAALEASGT
jgi:phenylpropionate dioxygenase-like ring-hydroxylating dioxygenase large terminal subunit